MAALRKARGLPSDASLIAFSLCLLTMLLPVGTLLALRLLASGKLSPHSSHCALTLFCRPFPVAVVRKDECRVISRRERELRGGEE